MLMSYQVCVEDENICDCDNCVDMEENYNSIMTNVQIKNHEDVMTFFDSCKDSFGKFLYLKIREQFNTPTKLVELARKYTTDPNGETLAYHAGLCK